MYNLSKFETIRNQLSELQSEISSLNIEEKQIPELIEKTNLLRQNELLKKLTQKTSLLLDVYSSYVDILEQLVSKSNITKSGSGKHNIIVKKKTRSTPKKIKKSRSTPKKIKKSRSSPKKIKSKKKSKLKPKKKLRTRR